MPNFLEKIKKNIIRMLSAAILNDALRAEIIT